jgi:hypothetical protein
LYFGELGPGNVLIYDLPHVTVFQTRILIDLERFFIHSFADAEFTFGIFLNLKLESSQNVLALAIFIE